MILTGYLDVPPDRLDEVRAALPLHVHLTRSEPGCLHFEVTESSAQQGRFAVSERFRDAAAFQAHQDRAAASEWAVVTRGLARDYTVTGLDE